MSALNARASAPVVTGSDLIDVQIDGSIARVSLNRPEVHNALSHEMLDTLHRVILELSDCDAVKVVVLDGHGRSFCSGFELSTSSDAVYAVALDTDADHRRVVHYLDVVMSVIESRLIFVGAVHGHCLGVGFLFAAACDLLVVEENATFGMPMIPIGAAFVSAPLGVFIGAKRAKRMSLVRAGSIDGRTAHDWGVATDLVGPGEARDGALDLATEVARMPSAVLRLEKRGLQHLLEVQGLRTAFAAAADLDALAHSAAEVHDLKAAIKEHGLKNAVVELGL